MTAKGLRPRRKGPFDKLRTGSVRRPSLIAREMGKHIDTQRKIERAAALIVNSKYIVALTGAGISTPSGVPDFRSPGSGLWEKVNSLLIASSFSFRVQPQAFYEWARPLARKLLEAEPKPAHRAPAELVEDYRLLAADRRPRFMTLEKRAQSLAAKYDLVCETAF